CMPSVTSGQYNGQTVTLDFSNRTNRNVTVEYEVGGSEFNWLRQRVPLYPGMQLHDRNVRNNSTITVDQDGRTTRFRMDRHYNVVEFTGSDTNIDPWQDGDFQVHLNNLTDHSIEFTADRGRRQRLEADYSTVLNLRNRTTVEIQLENRAEYRINVQRDTDIIVLPRAVFVDGQRIEPDRGGREPDRYRDYRVTIDNRSSERVEYRYEDQPGRFSRRTSIRRNDRVNLTIQDHNELEIEIGGEPHLFVISQDTTIRLIRGFIFVNSRRYNAHHDKQNRLGIEYELDRDGGVIVRQVQRGSLAERMGLRNGMLILSVNGEHIHSTDAYEDAVERAMSDRGGRITVEVLDRDQITEKSGQLN
ncbi:MAG: PDZ domain-containing protein, partial [Planctomycetota bacterium]